MTPRLLYLLTVALLSGMLLIYGVKLIDGPEHRLGKVEIGKIIGDDY